MFSIIKELVYKELGIPQLYYKIIINELEQALNMGKIPTGGLIIDAHHAVAGIDVDYFLCRDKRLSLSVKSLFNDFKNYDKRNREVIDNFDEFTRKISKIID